MDVLEFTSNLDKSHLLEPQISSPIQKIIDDLHASLKDRLDGTVATYIPELGKADPAWFGICLVTADGHVYEAGDTRQGFTIQSISKPFVYGMALEDNGKSKVLEKVWMEPSGEAFNAISLQEGNGMPANPMINAGAIATTSLLEGGTSRQKVHRILDGLGRYAGRNLGIDNSVYQSESDTGHRNRAIGHLLRSFDIIEEHPRESLEAYFMQCSISVNCRDLGIMAATLANDGINPVTNVRAVVGDYVGNILSVMGSCGMYDAAGEWIYNVGMPAKSGVAGGIVAVLPGQLGIGVFSPLLDSQGNSVRGIEACREISRQFDLHMFHVPRLGRSVLRRMSDLSIHRSNHLRSPEECDCLDQKGNRVGILELQGELLFGSSEIAIRRMVEELPKLDQVVIDFTHVPSIDFSACHVIGQTLAAILNSGRRVTLVQIGHISLLARVFRKEFPAAWKNIQVYRDLDTALEHAENHLLDQYETRCSCDQPVPVEQSELFKKATPEDILALKELLAPVRFQDGDSILQPGEESRSLFILTCGRASAWIGNSSGSDKRIATFSPGMAFGEMALLDRAPRSAFIRAEGTVEAMELSFEAFQKLAKSHPQLHVTLLENISRVLCRRIRDSLGALSAVYL